MSRVVCPGSFDPVTNGHLDIIERAGRLFDQVIVAVGVNATKARMFTVDERLEMLRQVTADLPNVRVGSFDGLLVDYCRANGAAAVVKGLRAAGDFEFEVPMAQMNAELAGVQTLFLAASGPLGFVSSSLVKEVAGLGGDVTGLVPEAVLDRLLARLGR